MNFRIQSSGLAGEPNDWDWSQFYEFKPEDEEQIKAMGEMFVVVSLGVNKTGGGHEGDDLISAGRDLVFGVRQRYYISSGQNTLENLKEAVNSVVQESAKSRKQQLGIVVKKEDTVYLVCLGGAKICLFRQGILTPLLKSENEKLVSASGRPKEGDIFLLCTDTFWKEFGGGRLKAALGAESIRDVVEQFTPMIHSKESSGDVAAMLVLFDEFDEDLSFNNRPGGNDSAKVHIQPQVPSFNLHSRLRGFLKKSLYVKGVEENAEFTKRRKVSASVGVLLLFLLVVSIFFGIRQKKQQDLKKSYEQDLASAKHSLEESENLLSLDPERSRELFLDARGKVLGLSSDINDPEILDLRKKLQEKQGQILGEYKKDAQLFVDLGLLSDGFSGTDFVATQDYIYTLDSASKRIIRVSVSSKRAEVVAGPSKINQASKIIAYLNNIYVLNSQGIFDVTSSDSQKVIDNTWQGEVLPYSYAANIYVLEKNASRIWRYSGNGSEFGSGKEWLSESASVDLTQVVSWAIDGDIWVLTKDSKIYKMALGNLQPFSLDGSFIDGGSFDYLFTSDGVGNLYFLDRKYSRVLVFDKEGKYKAQYISDAVFDTTQIVVSEKEGKIILLNGNKLFSIDLAY
jgi:hypothetical protein